ncbi:uncharacterized protein LOC111412805 [Olea europaea subsp. europaea]|uniref:Uncharacterized protein LOC111412805, partial n=1 Tax=Olea europaea subsp. europaea TaxID=158383 RepID=A0A8S0T1C6_OLEEU|nr:uncharacterized protein LOC111412805 [Olea europaea subsp. europaea]
MLDILFGWRKASKCKKLIRRVQCRLKLLKNKRSCIVKHLREDVAELLQYGHEQSAFDRIEQLFKDESMVEVYDLIQNLCEYIIINLRYIRKHKDCPDGINEAVSTLIFASARFGDLPELRSIRKLFGERYGHSFTKAALELLPGNHVNHQVFFYSNQHEVKFKLLDEIGRGLLLLEYKPELQEESVTKTIGNKISSSDVQTHNDEMPVSIIEGTQGKMVYIDLFSEKQTISKSAFNSYKFTAVQNSAHIIEEKLVMSLQHNDMVKFTVSEFIGETNGGGMADESSSETSVRLPEEVTYLDDIEEFVSPLSKDGNSRDQRFFVFKSSAVPLKPKIDYANENDLKEKIMPRNEKVSKNVRKTRKAGGKRLVSIENVSVNDVECARYYGQRLSKYKTKSLNQSKYQKKISVEDKSRIQENEKRVEHKEKDLSCRETAASEVFTMHSLEEETNQYGRETETEQPNLRAMSPTENVLRSNYFPLQEINGFSSYRHIHPKLPDYDELAAKFIALKKANLQNKQNQLI